MAAPPVIIVPDTTPLIHLAAGDLLHLLPAMGRVVVSDVVAMEATRLPDKPWAQQVSAWFKAAAVEIADTEIGALCRLAHEMGRRPPRHAGEMSIFEWLQDCLRGQASRAFVVYEDPMVRRLVMAKDVGAEIVALTTHSFLELAEERGILSSAEKAWLDVVTAAPTASRVSLRSTRKPSQ